MTDNIVMFDEFDDVRQIGAQYLDLPRIVLEGMDDVRLFRQYWFVRYLDRVDFVEAGALVGGSGCTAVAAAVRKSIDEDEIPAFGMVDRDWLFRTRDWTTLFDVDDARFDASTSHPEYFTARRWEIEAYLLEPDLLADLVKSFTRKGQGTAAECNAALGKALEEIVQLLMAQRLYVACHVAGLGLTANHLLHKKADELLAEIEKELCTLTDAGGLAAAELVRPLLDAIAGTSPAADEDRWRWLLRFVDTKRLIGRLVKRLDTVGDIRWILAAMMEKSDRRPKELENRIENIIAATS